GHQKAITALTLSGSTTSPTFFTGSYDGRVCAWHYGRDGERAAAVPLGGAGHANQVTSIVIQGDALLSAGMDDVVRVGSVEGVAYGSTALPTGSQPRTVAVADDGTYVVATLENVQVYDKSHRKLAISSNLGYNPTTVAISPDGSIVVVGGEDSQPHAYTLTPGTGDLSPLAVPISPTRGAVSALAISRSTPPLLAAGDAQGKIQVYDLTTGATVISQWVFHSGRISSLAWSNDGKFVVSGGLDTNVFVWSVDRPGKRVQIKKAHTAGVNGVGFVGENKVVSAGQDATVKVWEVVLP
ncbi:WD40-repeat-containing domain protein, partial [Endogone sp. FLAS-F59071]